jgi:hypothetical protein
MIIYSLKNLILYFKAIIFWLGKLFVYSLKFVQIERINIF